MIDPRFYSNAGPVALGDLADSLGGTLAGGAPRDFIVTDLATLDDATSSEIAMFGDRRYRDACHRTKAGVILTNRELAASLPSGNAHLILVASPRHALAEIAWLFYPKTTEPLGLDDEGRAAALGNGALVADTARIATGAVIGARTVIGAGAVIGHGVVIGQDCVIGPNSTVGFAILGDRVQIYPGACIGAQGFGFVPVATGLRRVPQLGRVILGDDVEIGANSAVDRGTIGDTVIGPGCAIDNLVQIGHNVKMGRSSIICGQAGISGSVEIGNGVVIGGAGRVADHVKIGDGAQLGGGGGAIQDVEAGAILAGLPAIPIRDWHRQTLGLAKMFSRPKKKAD
jgi:UDP-3-O-[3-hydroxymyristoyl] glucosamine N-acyltransferase